MFEISLDAFQTMGVAMVFLYVGKFLRARINLFQRFAIPAPVVGGTLFALVALLLRQTGILAMEYDETFRNLFMTMFFCSVGFNASIKVLKQGGKKVVIFLLAATILVILQNILAIGLSSVVGIDPGRALMTGSTPMTGGHGTSGAVGPSAERLGIENASSIALTAATFGLISGSLLGGPTATRLIDKNDLARKKQEELDAQKEQGVDMSLLEEEGIKEDGILEGFFILVLATGLGVFLTNWINAFLTTYISESFVMPIYTGPMILGILIRNVFDGTRFEIPNTELQVIGEACLQVFLAIALMTVKLWDLAEIAGEMIILLVAQVIMMYLFATHVTFRMMGSDYDAAVLAAGHCGFGLGATPNGIANMQSVSEKYIYSPVPFFVLPIVGGFFIDFVNILIINVFLGIVV